MKRALVIALLTVTVLGLSSAIALAGWHFGFEQSLLGAPTLPGGPPPCEATFGFKWDNSDIQTDGLISGGLSIGNPDLWAFMPAEWSPGIELSFAWFGWLGFNLESEWLFGLLPSPDFWWLKDWTGLLEAEFTLSEYAALFVGADVVYVPGGSKLDLDPYLGGKFAW